MGNLSHLDALEAEAIYIIREVAAERKYHRRGTPLVTKSQYDEVLNDPTYRYVQEGDCYIVRGINQITMYKMVKLLDERFDLHLKVIYE